MMKPITEKHLTKCFIIMPISTPESWVQKYLGDEDHFNHVLNHLLIPAIEKAGFEPISPKTKGSELIHGEIIRNIESAEFVLCDMSVLNPNVFFELGIRTSLNKPVCMIKDDLTEKVPFDTSIINNHTYLSALNPWTLDEQIEDLANHIKDSFEKCKGSNSLWKYFGLSSSAQPIKEEDSDAKIDFLIKQVEALKEQSLIKSSPTPERAPEKVLEKIFNRISQIVSPTGASVKLVERIDGESIRVRLSKNLDKSIYDKIFRMVQDEFGIRSVNWT